MGLIHYNRLLHHHHRRRHRKVFDVMHSVMTKENGLVGQFGSSWLLQPGPNYGPTWRLW